MTAGSPAPIEGGGMHQSPAHAREPAEPADVTGFVRLPGDPRGRPTVPGGRATCLRTLTPGGSGRCDIAAAGPTMTG